jgi:hypothetical protein
MNEKIKEFAKQSGFKVNWQHEDVQAIKMEQYREFAELIIRECVNALWTEDCHVSDLAIIDFNEKKRKIYERMGITE